MRRLPQYHLVEHVHKFQLKVQPPDRLRPLVSHLRVQVGDRAAEEILRGAHSRVAHNDRREIGLSLLGQDRPGRDGRRCRAPHQSQDAGDDPEDHHGEHGQKGSGPVFGHGLQRLKCKG